MLHHLQVCHLYSIMVWSYIPQRGDTQIDQAIRSHGVIFPTISVQAYDFILDHTITPDRNLEHLVLFVDVKPLDFIEASQYYAWIISMKKEIKVIKRNQTWNLVSLTIKRRHIAIKQFYKVKHSKMVSFSNITQDLLKRDSYKKIGFNSMLSFVPIARIDIFKLVVVVSKFLQWNLV